MPWLLWFRRRLWSDFLEFGLPGQVVLAGGFENFPGEGTATEGQPGLSIPFTVREAAAECYGGSVTIDWSRDGRRIGAGHFVRLQTRLTGGRVPARKLLTGLFQMEGQLFFAFGPTPVAAERRFGA